MQEAVDDRSFAEWHLQSSREAIRTLAWVSTAAFAGFALSDIAVASGDALLRVLGVRVVVLAAIWLQMARLHRKTALGYVDGAVCCAIVGLGVIGVTLATGDPSSRYLDTLMLTFVGYASFIPATPRTAGVTLGALVLAYNLAALACGLTGPPAVFSANNAMLLLAAIMGEALVVFGNTLRRREYLALRSERAKSDQLEQAAAELRTLDRAKNDFFANVNHELRTPLTMVLAQLQTLQEEVRGTEAGHLESYIESSRRSAFRLLGLVNDILDLTRLDMGKHRLKLTPLDLAAVARAIVGDIRPMARRKGLRLEFTEPSAGGLDGVVQADAAQIDRVLINLLTNAVKFTDDGGEVRVALEPGQDSVRVTVTDTGVGISSEGQARIFDRGFQEPNQHANSGGLGIGLYLSKLIVTAHTGTIGVRSALRAGTCVYFDLPRAPSIAEEFLDRRVEDHLASSERRDGPNLAAWDEIYRQRYRLIEVEVLTDRRVVNRQSDQKSKGSILIVDDTRELVTLLAEMLGKDYQIYGAFDGKEALEKALKFRPELIITDVMMPRRTGLDLLKDVREDPQLRHIPVVMVTGSGMMKLQIESGEFGADDYIDKPFDLNEVRATVGRLIKRQQEHVSAILDSRAEGLEILAKGLAHNVLNALHFVTGSLMLFKQLAEEAAAKLPGELAEGVLTEAQEHYLAGMHGVERVQAGIKSLQRSADNAATTDFNAEDINDIVMRAATATHTQHTAHLNLAATRVVAVRRGHVEDVLINLIKNAQEAGGEQCELSLETVDNEQVGGVRVLVKDHGPGIPAEALSRIFDVYYTTKPEGSGLGLAISRKIIRDHGGNIEVQSAEGEGAVFSIWLPSAGMHRAGI